MRRMQKITGRSDDMLIIRGVNVFPTQIEEMILRQPELSPHYTLEVKRPHLLDELTVHVEMSPDLSHTPQAVRKKAAALLAHNVKAYIGVTIDVLLAEPGGVQRSIGKAQRIIDKRPKA
jgi:phenylacetate-CoA ligase